MSETTLVKYVVGQQYLMVRPEYFHFNQFENQIVTCSHVDAQGNCFTTDSNPMYYGMYSELFKCYVTYVASLQDLIDGHIELVDKPELPQQDAVVEYSLTTTCPYCFLLVDVLKATNPWNITHKIFSKSRDSVTTTIHCTECKQPFVIKGIRGTRFE